MTLPTVPSPPLAPFAANVSQASFLRFHHTHLVTSWRWHFLGTQLRAFNESGHSVTIWRDDLDGLVAAGLMARSFGESVMVTQTGRESLEAPQHLKGSTINQDGDAT